MMPKISKKSVKTSITLAIEGTDAKRAFTINLMDSLRLMTRNGRSALSARKLRSADSVPLAVSEPAQ